MAVTRTTVLAQGTTAADSSVITVDAGAVALVSLFVASGNIPPGSCQILLKTPGADVAYSDGDADEDGKASVSLSGRSASVQISGPAEVIVRRPEGMDVGVFTAT